MNSKPVKRIILLLILLFMAVPVYADQYASTIGIDGSPNDGSISKPWRTIQYLGDHLTCGENGWIRGGTYTGNFGVQYRVHGNVCTSYANGITIQNFPGEVVIQNVTGRGTGMADCQFQNDHDCYPLRQSDGNGDANFYWTIQADVVGNWILDGTNGDYDLGGVITNFFVAHIRYIKLEVRNCQRACGYFDGSYHEFIDINEHNAGLGCIGVVACDNPGSGPHAFAVGWYIPANHSTVLRGFYHDNAGGGLQATNSGHNDDSFNLLDGVTFYGNGTGSGSGAHNGGAGGAQMSNGTGNVIRNSIAYDNFQAGFAMGAAGVCDDCVMENNTAFRNLANGFLLANISEAGGGARHLIARNNIAYANGGSDIVVYSNCISNSNGPCAIQDNLTGNAVEVSTDFHGNTAPGVIVTGNTTGDPQFVSVTTNFTPQNALAIATGLDLSARFTNDYNSATRAAGAFDRGAIAVSTGTCTPDHLTFTQQPQNAITGNSIGVILVAIKNASNVTCTSRTDTVTVAKDSTATWGTLSGTLPQAAVLGVATFSDLTVTVSAGAGSITAAASGLTGATSNSITISAVCTPTHLTFTQQPSDAVLNATLGTVKVALKNSSEVTCTASSATITLTKNASATWGTLASSSSLSKATSSGVSTWTDLSVTTTTGTGAIDASDSGALTDTTSNSITISVSSCTPDHLTFTSQPSNAGVGASLGNIAIEIRDSGNIKCAGAVNTVTLTKHAGVCTGMTLNGTVSGAASSGTFSTANVNLTGTTGTCSLDAAASGLTGATSSTFTIAARSLDQVIPTSYPQGTNDWITITGTGTGWVQGTSVCAIGAAGTVIETFVVNATLAACNLVILSSATTGLYDVTMTTGVVVDTKTNGLLITANTEVETLPAGFMVNASASSTGGIGGGGLGRTRNRTR